MKNRAFEGPQLGHCYLLARSIMDVSSLALEKTSDQFFVFYSEAKVMVVMGAFFKSHDMALTQMSLPPKNSSSGTPPNEG